MMAGLGPVLVTGATGFIGREVVRRLLAAGRPVLALARERQGQHAWDRIVRAVGFVPDERLLEVVEADLTRPGFGLGETQRRRLRARVETVIHCAGDTTFCPQDMLSFRAGHIDGPLALLRELGVGRLGCWAQLSTAYVCGRRSGRVLEQESDVGQSFHNPYERIKLESELLMRRAGDQLGVDVRVFRPSIVVGAAPVTGGGNPSNLFFTFIRMVAELARLSNGSGVRLRIGALPQARFNIVPVEYVAGALVALAEHPDGPGATFHLVVSDAPSQDRMLGMITEHFNLRGLSLVDSRRLGLANLSPLERRVARMLSGYREYLEQDVWFDDSNARGLLERCEVARPVLSPEVVHRLIGLALGPAPAGRDGARVLCEPVSGDQSARESGLRTPVARARRALPRLLLPVLLPVLIVTTAWGQSPFVEELRTFSTRYHENPARLDALVQGLEDAIKTDANVDDLVALAQASFIWGDIRATTGEQKLEAYGRGRQAAKRALDLAPRNVLAHFWYATNTGRWGQTKGVVRSLFLLPTVKKEIRTILDLDPRFTAVYALAGNVYYEVPGLLGGDLDKAEEAFRKGLDLDPQFTGMRVGLGKTLLRKGRVAEARRELQAVLEEKEPRNPADWTLKDSREARQLLESLKGKQ